jgi:hypothetical protein
MIMTAHDINDAILGGILVSALAGNYLGLQLGLGLRLGLGSSKWLSWVRVRSRVKVRVKL